jgi:hypothetical protein
MTENERLARIDERTLSMKEDLMEIKSHLNSLNGSVSRHEKRILALEGTRSFVNWFVGIFSFLFISVVAFVLAHVGLSK